MRIVRLLFVIALGSSWAASAQTWHFRTHAGSTSGGGYADGPAAAARFSSPANAAVCADAILIADAGNHAIRRISRDGDVTTWAGALTEPGSANGDRTAARFRRPAGIAADSQCNLIVADRDNHIVRRISSAGQVTTIAGSAGNAGDVDGPAASARFNAPMDVALDTDGSIWVADSGNRKIRRIAPNGSVTTVRNLRTRVINAPTSPLGLALDAAGTLYVADYQALVLETVTRDGGGGSLVSNVFVSDVAVTPDGAVFISNFSEQLLQRVEANRTLTTITGIRSRSGGVDGPAGTATFDQPRGLVLDTDGSFILVEEAGSVIRRATTGGNVTTIAGTASAGGHVNGIGSDVRFQSAADVDVDGEGVAYVADGATIRRIARDGTTTTIAGTFGESLHRDGSRAEARFASVSGIALEPAGTLVVVDGTTTVRRVTMAGEVTTIAGAPGATGNIDGPGAQARFNHLAGIAVAQDGTIYVADAVSRSIRKISGTTVSTLAGNFTLPMGIDVDAAGNVWFWDENAASLHRVTPAGEATLVASSAALNTLLTGLAIAPDGTAYIGGLRIQSLLRVQPGSSTIEPFAGVDESIGNQNGTPQETRFRQPTRLDVAPDGRIFVRDSNRAIRIASPNEPPTIALFTTASEVIRAGESATLSWSSSGGETRIEPGGVVVASSGTLAVTPSITTEYSLIVRNGNDEVRKTAIVYVATARKRSAGHP